MNGFRAGLLSLALLAGLAARAEEAPKPDAPKNEAPAAGADKKEAAAPGAKTESAPGLPAFPLKSEFFQYVLDKSEDDEEAMQLEFHALEDILVALQASTAAHLQENVSPAIQTETAYRDLMKNPDTYRGHVVQLRGVLELVERFPVPDNRSGLEALYRGQLSTMTGKLYTFFSIQRPPPELMKRPARITGVFLKRYAFKNRLAGEKLTWTPAVIVRDVEAYSEADAPPTRDPISNTTAMLIAVFLAFIVVRVIFEFRRQKAKAVRENPFQQRRKMGGAAPPPPRPAPPPAQNKK
ncbi:MAG: hypothetical protein ABSE73_01330 [Planctomycetota bacterium]